MALQIASDLVPAGGGTFYLLEDTYIKGGLQSLPNVAARDQIAISNLKVGQLVLTLEDSTLWQVTEIVIPNRDNPDAVESVTWEQLNLGAIKEDAPEDGKTYGRKDGVWTEVTASGGGGQLNTRQVVIHTIPSLPVSGSVEFVLELAVSCIVLKLEVSRPVRIKAFGNVTKDESNPYEFVATEDHLIDDGTMILSDGTKFRSRNFSIFSNSEPSPSENIYFTVESVDDAEGPALLTITYLPLEILPPPEEPGSPDVPTNP